MRLVIQRAKNAKCIVDGKVISEIGYGFMILVGFSEEDKDMDDFNYYVNKITNMRIFTDNNDKLNLSIKDIKGEILLISQFTLYGDTRKGNRPSFTKSLGYDSASKLYDKFASLLNEVVPTHKGEFGSDMKIEFTNDGPVTILMDSKEL